MTGKHANPPEPWVYRCPTCGTRIMISEDLPTLSGGEKCSPGTSGDPATAGSPPSPPSQAGCVDSGGQTTLSGGDRLREPGATAYPSSSPPSQAEVQEAWDLEREGKLWPSLAEQETYWCRHDIRWSL
jgi:hypothetical protein